MTEDDCTCSYVDPKYWTTHYGAIEPGSTQEFDPDCPVHACPEPGCGWVRTVVEEHDEQIGYEEQGRDVRVYELACGHSYWTPRS